MRKMQSHKTGSDLNDLVEVFALDDPDHDKGGGACHRYVIGFFTDTGEGILLQTRARIDFQHGPLKEVKVNGCSDESILAVLIDRLEHFQAGPFACEHNGKALAHLLDAMQALQHRTRDRLARGVEGKSEA